MGFLHLLQEQELLLLFAVLTTGLALGHVRISNFSLGISGVLFTGILFGAWRGDLPTPLSLSPTLRDFGLVLFVYAVGLTSGPGFFSAFARRGLSLNLAVGGALVAGAGVAMALGRVLALPSGIVAGVFCGALTNTPALAAVVELARGSSAPAAPTLGYSVTYPFGIIAALALFHGLVRVRGRAFANERGEAKVRAEKHVFTGNFVIENPEMCEQAIGALRIRDRTGLLISRVRHGKTTFVPSKYTVLHLKDIVTVVGTPEDLERAKGLLGTVSLEHLEARREDVDMRRILMSKKALVGRRLGDLDLGTRFHAQVTRLRRADLDLVPSEDTRLELGDRLRVVAPAAALPALGEFFGDSVKDASTVDFLGLAIGIALGLLVGQIPIPTPGGSIRLGIAGGPLLVALALGRQGRLGPFLWSLPFEANTVMRELGLLLFLAAVGTTAGAQLSTASGSTGLSIFGLGLAVTLATNVLLMLALAWWARAGVIATLGAASGLQTQPATLAAAYDISGGNDEVYVAYSLVYPVAMVGKIMLAQVVYLWVSSG